MHPRVAAALRVGLGGLIRTVDRAAAADGRAFDPAEIFAPHTDSRRFGWTHYGVMIPDLPAPHNFFSVMSLIGATGSVAFDDDAALVAEPRRNASVVAGTAASHPAHFGNYRIGSDFRSRPDGSLVAFGEDLLLTGTYPDRRLTGSLDGVDIDLRLHHTDKVSWFFRTPVYRHLSLLTEYSGTFTHAGEVTAASGLCAFEYGACPSPYVLRSCPLPTAVKAPLDYFVYHVVNLDDDNQVLLSQYSIDGVPLMTTALHRSRTSYGTRFADVDFSVVELRDEPEPTPYGVPMRLPASTRFVVRDRDGGCWLDLTTEMDSPFIFGLGTGFVSGFRHTATWRGEHVEGRGYVEYIDRRR
ncbi:hypothetical protein QSJ18_15420 [Gordonia sp. ABSL1-1]|uniref:DUF6670 family protein n=1 Tax=Gordonia sp. ABSL1-1 TaxID=3053923 RepID=UPI002573030E|nr:DUF6670 family protein [Gordonia sp. ABSL1-1]MDL9938142.1 hypothetical protein [Gordonia sp. ABSL1-1]